MRRGPVQPGKLGGSPRVVAKGPPAPPTSAPLRAAPPNPGSQPCPWGGREFSRTVLHWGGLWPVLAFVPTVRTFQVQNIREGLSVNNDFRQGKTKDSAARGTRGVPGRDGGGAGTGMRPAPPPPPLPRWGVSASLTRAARGRRHRARAADPDSVSPRDPPRCQIVVARLSARPVPALHVHIVKLGRVTHESKAPSLTSVRVGRHGADSWHAQGPGGTADAPAALGRRDRAQPASWRCLGSPGEAGVPWGADGAGGSQDQAGGAGCAGAAASTRAPCADSGLGPVGPGLARHPLRQLLPAPLRPRGRAPPVILLGCSSFCSEGDISQ